MIDQDKRLIRDAKSGNRNAFGKLVKKYEKKILYLSYDLVGNYEDAKDLAQEVFIRSFQRLHQFEERSGFSTWVYRITVNLAIDFRRRQSRQRRQSSQDLSNPHNPRYEFEPSKTPLDELADKDQIEQALKKLSINQRTATVLKYFHQKPTNEIAQIMGCQESTVRNHIFRALGSLKKVMGDSA